MNNQSNKQCKVCGKDIPIIAKRCNHCDSYQNWRRYINIGNSTLTLLIALISVMSASVANFKNAMEVNDESIDFGVFSVITEPNSHGVRLFVSNNGTRTGAVCGGMIGYKDLVEKDFNDVSRYHDNDEILNPSETKKIKFRLSDEFAFSSNYSKNDRCYISLKIWSPVNGFRFLKKEFPGKLTRVEKFDWFLSKIAKDKTFQISRIEYPLKWISLPEEKWRTSIDEVDYKFIDYKEMKGFNPPFPLNPEKKFSITFLGRRFSRGFRKQVLLTSLDNNQIKKKLTFEQREEGKWYLISMFLTPTNEN